MPILSATEAISPALGRTRRLLFQPFSWGTYLKLCAVAVFTEGFGSNFGSSKHGGAPAHTGPQTMAFHFNPAVIAALIAFGIVAIIVGIVLLYLAVRLRFALFNCLSRQTTWIAPGWRMYREQARRFFVLTIVVGIGYLAVVLAALLPFAKGFIQLYRESQLNGSVDVPQAIGLVLQLAPVLMVLMLAGIAVDVVMRDFMLPHMALENASAGDAFAAVWANFTAEKGSFVLYAILRILMPILASIGMFIVLVIPSIIVFGFLGLLIAGIHAAVAGAAPGVMFVGTFVQVLLGMVIFAIGLLMAICFGGPLSIAIRNYALMFYGSRYPALYAILFPPAPPATAPAAAPLPA